MKGNLKASALKVFFFYIFVSFLFQHDDAPVHKAAPYRNAFPSFTGLHRAQTSTPSNTSEMNWI